MDISFRNIGQFKMVDINENINTENVHEFENTLNHLICEQNLHLVVNLSKVNYICSYSINILVRVWKKIVELNGSVCTISSDKELCQLLTELNVHKIMPLYTSEAAFRNHMDECKKASVQLPVRTVGKYRVIDIARPINIISGYHELNDKLNALVAGGHKHLGFNLYPIDHIYSEIAGLINKWSWLAKSSGGSFCLLGLNDDQKKHLSLMGLDKFVMIYDSEAELRKQT